MFQNHRFTTRPVTTAHLTQTMTLLQLPGVELRQRIDSELASNPALELLDERRCPVCRKPLPPHGPCPVCSKSRTPEGDDPVVFVSPREDFYSHRGDVEDDSAPDDNFSAEEEELPAFVLRQVASELEAQDRKIAAYLLLHLNEDGLLTIDLAEIAGYYHVPISQVETVHRLILHAEPVGVGARTPQEALLVQLEVLAETHVVPELARRLVSDGMELLSRRQFPELARQFKTTSRMVQQAEQFISENLNPFPARSHWGESRPHAPDKIPVYHNPDIIISYQNDDPKSVLMVEIIMPLNGTLRVNPLFRQAIRQATDEKKDAWKSDIERASLFVKCLQQRNHTMQRLMSRLATLQRDFILYGEKHLNPVTRAQLSEELGVHESTISRAVGNKAVQLPNRRIVPLAMFFERNLNVRTVLRDLVSAEPTPYSDTQLAHMLAEKGFRVARRTVAKYRAIEGILPAHLRHPTST